MKQEYTYIIPRDFASYIEWIMEHPKNFKFTYMKIVKIMNEDVENPPSYTILHKDPDTGKENRVLSLYVKDDFLIDNITELKLVHLPSSQIDLEKLNKLCKEDKYF